MKRYQRRNRAGLAKERWIIAATAVFVLAALTLTGVYVRDINEKNNDGYVVDFSAMDDNVAQKADEIRDSQAQTRLQLAENVTDTVTPSDDLDYDPYFQEANSSQIENDEVGTSDGLGDHDLIDNDETQAGSTETAQETSDSLPEVAQDQTAVADAGELTAEQKSTLDILKEIASSKLEVGEAVMASEPPDASDADASDAIEATESSVEAEAEAEPEVAASSSQTESADIPAISTSMQTALTFKDGDNLVWPIVGNVLINYSMDKTVYFPTLQQYKYNPAIVIQAAEGDIISAAAAGKVISIYNDPQIGQAVIMELGSGYELTYGQLANVLVSEGSYVAAGDVIGEVAAPTKYFSVEGTNVYFKLTKDGTPVNPMAKLS